MKPILSLILILALSAPAFATHGFNARQLRQAQRAQARLNAQAIQAAKLQAALHAQAFRAPVYVAPQQFNAGCHDNGALQLNAGHCFR